MQAPAPSRDSDLQLVESAAVIDLRDDRAAEAEAQFIDLREQRGAADDVVLMVASLGGHLHELRLLSDRVVPGGATGEWMAPPGPQSAELGGPVHHVRNTSPRDWRSALLNLRALVSTYRRRRPMAVVSTGAAVAVPALAAARCLGIEAHYIESAARTHGPSLTGRLLRSVPGVHLYTQWPCWSDDRWQAVGSVFDGFRPALRPALAGHVPPLRKVVVTVGTQDGYGFERLIRRLVEILPDGVEVLWQVGSTDTTDLPIDAHRLVPPAELHRAMMEADVIVAHAGIGSALAALSAGRMPVLVPRRAAYGEHVDDHQTEIADQISELGLGVVREVDDLTFEDLERAARMAVRQVAKPPLPLSGRLGAAIRRGVERTGAEPAPATRPVALSAGAAPTGSI